ncbi:hypothetical protein [Roseobacter sp.]
MTKAPYTAPVLRAHGKVEALTKGGTDGGSTDAMFPQGTPFSSLTFS